jgi:hypothetical protein
VRALLVIMWMVILSYWNVYVTINLVDNAACLYSLGVLHNSTPLINVCEYYITAHFKQVRYSEAYTSLDAETQQHFLKLVKQAIEAINK